MLFYTKMFLLFWAISYCLHYIFRRNQKIWPLLLAIASSLFYAKLDARFLFLIFIVASSDYILGILIENAKNSNFKKHLVVFSIIVNLTVLGFFKYFNFFISAATDFLGALGFHPHLPFLEIVLPIGISFFTFESLSYIIEIYRGNMKASRNFIEYYLFIAFFPHLVAGPIIQPKILIEQFRRGPEITEENLKNGIWRFMLGLFKKLLIADQLAFFIVDPFFKNPQLFNSAESWIGVIGYSFQIYFDFSGYSDMALGLASFYGFKLPENFNYPYLAINIRDFWRRWHISLSNWLRDYLYISLGGGRVTLWLKYRNIFLTMLLGGVWHGASYNFLIWGLLHGIFITSSHFLNDYFKLENRLKDRLVLPRILTTFLLVTLAWVFFRADNLTTVTIIMGNLFKFNGLSFNQLPVVGFYFIALSFLYYILAHFKFYEFMNVFSMRMNAATVVLLVVSIVCCVFIFDKQYSPFIYFQF